MFATRSFWTDGTTTVLQWTDEECARAYATRMSGQPSCIRVEVFAL
jgi:hypothetical protein